MSVARLDATEKYKGIDSTLKALPDVLQKYKLRYLIVGSGSDRARLEKLVKTLGLENIVQFLGGVSNAELINLYRLADSFVLPSIEGFGIVYLEALLCGVPVISGNQDGSAEPLQDGKLGWQVDPSDTIAIGNAIIESLERKDLRTSPSFLREETIKKFGMRAFEENVKRLFG